MQRDIERRRGLLKGLIGAAIGTSMAELARGAGGAGAREQATQPSAALIASSRDFGAVGDGKADDTAALQRAFDHGGLVIVAAGTYCYSELRAGKPLILQGEGARSSIFRKTSPGGD